MKFFLDTEFMEDGRTIDLLSLAIVSEDNLEFYAVNEEADLSKANDWVKEHVIPQLKISHGDGGPCVEVFSGRREIRDIMMRWLSPLTQKPEFWGYYADYDWVAFCQLFGPMTALPKGLPMYCNDIKQFCDELDNPELPPQGKGEHHALLDARWNKKAYEFLVKYDRESR